LKYITHLIHFEGPSHLRDEAEDDDDDDFKWPHANDNQAPTLEATGDVGVSSVECPLGLVPSPKAELAALEAVEAELPALEATGSEEISVKVPAVDVRIIDGNQVEGDGLKTLETTMSLTSTFSDTMADCDGDFFKLPSMTAELRLLPQLSGGYMNNNATCILLGLPLSNSGHY